MKTIIMTLGLALAIASCSSSKKEEKVDTKEVAKAEAAAPSSGISDYMLLKDALVQTNASAAKDAAAKLVESASKENWNAEIVEAAKTITSSTNVEVQRKAFKTLTDGLIASLKVNDSDDGVYVQYCPMAFNNTGASWLSISDQIRNPYFGDKMLKCGSVEEKL